jgi:LmbE family N-acetylglucosaminyl deacetylase
MVLDDGTASHPDAPHDTADRLAHLHERETRTAAQLLGLPSARLLMVGLLDGTIPTAEGAVFDAIVRAIALVMWARDCNVVLAPAPHTPDPAHQATHHIAQAVVARTGVGILLYPDFRARLPPTMPDATGWRLNIVSHLPAKHAAMAAHATLQTGVAPDLPTGRNWPSAVLSAEFHEVFLTEAAFAADLTAPKAST